MSEGTLEHLDWCWQLQSPDNTVELPTWISDAAEAFSKDPSKILDQAEQSVEQWLRRKQELAPAWEAHRAKLPEHISTLLGADKNLFLLQELLAVYNHLITISLRISNKDYLSSA